MTNLCTPTFTAVARGKGNKTVKYSNIIMLNLTKVYHNTPTCSQFTPGTAIPAPYSCLPVNIPTYRSHENPSITSVHLVPYLNMSAEGHHPGKPHIIIGSDCGVKWTGRTKIKACICEASLHQLIYRPASQFSFRNTELLTQGNPHPQTQSRKDK